MNWRRNQEKQPKGVTWEHKPRCALSRGGNMFCATCVLRAPLRVQLLFTQVAWTLNTPQRGSPRLLLLDGAVGHIWKQTRWWRKKMSIKVTWRMRTEEEETRERKKEWKEWKQRRNEARLREEAGCFISWNLWYGHLKRTCMRLLEVRGIALAALRNITWRTAIMCHATVDFFFLKSLPWIVIVLTSLQHCLPVCLFGRSYHYQKNGHSSRY